MCRVYRVCEWLRRPFCRSFCQWPQPWPCEFHSQERAQSRRSIFESKKEIPVRIHLEVRGAANERLITLGGCGVSSILAVAFAAVGRRAVIFRHFHRRYLALISFWPSLLFLHIRLANPQSSRLSHWQRFERHCIASYVLSIFYSIPWSCLFNR